MTSSTKKAVDFPRTTASLILDLARGIAAHVAACTEFHTERIRSWLERRLNLTGKVPSIQKADKLVGAGQ